MRLSWKDRIVANVPVEVSGTFGVVPRLVLVEYYVLDPHLSRRLSQQVWWFLLCYIVTDLLSV